MPAIERSVLRVEGQDDAHSIKHILAWLAWQEEPGLPYGLAVSKHYFRHDMALAGRFVDWFKRVFDCG